ncbi:MAG: hypothetical protein QXH91_04795 [Candidatus Bathyarchaeia archaeon]
MLLLEILRALLQAPRWKAKYVGELPSGIKEVIRETFESFSITFFEDLDYELLKEVCLSKGFDVMEKESRREEIYDQFGNLIETRVIEWKYPFRIVDSTKEIILFADPADTRKIYILPLFVKHKSIQIREDVLSVIDKYMKEKHD